MRDQVKLKWRSHVVYVSANQSETAALFIRCCDRDDSGGECTCGSLLPVANRPHREILRLRPKSDNHSGKKPVDKLLMTPIKRDGGLLLSEDMDTYLDTTVEKLVPATLVHGSAAARYIRLLHVSATPERDERAAEDLSPQLCLVGDATDIDLPSSAEQGRLQGYEAQHVPRETYSGLARTLREGCKTGLFCERVQIHDRSHLLALCHLVVTTNAKLVGHHVVTLHTVTKSAYDQSGRSDAGLPLCRICSHGDSNRRLVDEWCTVLVPEEGRNDEQAELVTLITLPPGLHQPFQQARHGGQARIMPLTAVRWYIWTTSNGAAFPVPFTHCTGRDHDGQSVVFCSPLSQLEPVLERHIDQVQHVNAAPFYPQTFSGTWQQRYM